ncbi:exopolysaccharide Pel transporter PelG [Chitinivorax sp. PXF-14]|uniref:exopolysaccharide Pel transporter PelG n=1 Tax=Chitinivorax sp. PXF-14 TaxID=3230488 RepID=UPI003465122E
MAGIGFEIRKLLKKESYFGLIQAYTYAGIIGAGPWILSILGVQAIGFLSLAIVVPTFLITQFQVSVTHMIAASLILTGILQLAFTRYISDRLFEKRDDTVLPNFIGALFAVMVAAGAIGLAAAVFLFDGLGVVYRLLMLSGFIILSMIWIATIFLSGMKQYKQILWLFLVGYSISVLAAVVLRQFGLEGLLLGFVLGQFVLLTGMMVFTLRTYPSNRFIEFDFIKPGRMYLSLMGVGFLYNFGVWIDKYMFWYTAGAGQQIIGPLNASLIYDLPIFLAYLSIIPGMAVFLVRMETDFVEYYDKFYDAVREGGSLEQIEQLRDEMVHTIRQGIFEIVKIQTIAVLVTFVAAPALLRLLGASQLYQSLLYIDVVSASTQVVLLGLLNVFFYLDKRRIVLLLTGIFVLLNIGLTALSLHWGPAYYGYGFALAVLITVLTGMAFLDRKLQTLEYETFMLQRG